jgi:hypothetical protein
LRDKKMEKRMKKQSSVLLVFIILATLLFMGTATAKENVDKKVVWAPLFDQWAQLELITSHNMGGNHPEFPLDPNQWKIIPQLIDQAIRAAHRKGIRTVDVVFFYDEVMLPPPSEEPEDVCVGGYRQIGLTWVNAIDACNATDCSSDPLKLRLRFIAQPGVLNLVRLTDVDTTGLPEPGEDLINYQALVTRWPDADHPHGEKSTTKEVLDLGKESIRRVIGNWVVRVIDRVQILAPHTPIEEVALALDGGGESSIMSSAGVVSFTGVGHYDFSASFEEKKDFYQKRQEVLKATYRAFAQAAKSKGVKASIFFQTWVMDGWVRGSFDLFDLLKGLKEDGVSRLHHTVWPRNPYHSATTSLSEREHRMIVAYSAAVARKLGIPFDTEFSWAWYYLPGTYFNGGSYPWVSGGFGGAWGRYDVGDFNGDGWADILFVDPGSVKLGIPRTLNVGLSTGKGFKFEGIQWLAEQEGVDFSPLQDGGLIGDFNGDGRDDLAFQRLGETAEEDTVWVILAKKNENGFERPQQWVGGNTFGGRWGKNFVGDFNGDGKDDLLFFQPDDLNSETDVNPNTLHVSLSTGSGFFGPGSGMWVGSNHFGGGWGNYFVGDFNGDGKDDLLFFQPDDHDLDLNDNDNTLHVSLSTGSGFFGPGSGMWVGRNGFGGSWGRYYLGNFDGDCTLPSEQIITGRPCSRGKTDILFFEPSNRTLHVAVSDGQTFRYNGIWLAPNYFGEDGGRYFPANYAFPGDDKGDSKTDIAYLANNSWFYVVPALNIPSQQGESVFYNAFQRTDENARSFRNQALAGFKFGADGMTYCQWSTRDIKAPPTTVPWRDLIGTADEETWDDSHLYGTGGLFSPSNAEPLSPARKAIYISTLGRIQCEERLNNLSCAFSDYLRWYNDFGLAGEINDWQVDILTDAMIKSGQSLTQYEMIYLPFETSQKIDPGVCRTLQGAKVRVQLFKAQSYTSPWLNCGQRQ